MAGSVNSRAFFDDATLLWLLTLRGKLKVYYVKISGVLQLFAKILHNGSEGGSVTHIHFRHVQLVMLTCVCLANVTLPLSLPLCKIFVNNVHDLEHLWLTNQIAELH